MEYRLGSREGHPSRTFHFRLKLVKRGGGGDWDLGPEILEDGRNDTTETWTEGRGDDRGKVEKSRLGNSLGKF